MLDMRQDGTPVPRLLRVAMQAVAGCGLVVALALWIYAGSLDTRVTDSDQNLFQFWAGVLATASLALLSAPLVIAMLRRAVREVHQGFRSFSSRL
jgi:hypothetical protein